MNAREPGRGTDAAWIAQARQLLDESASALDAATVSRLNRARQAALQQRRAARHWMLPAGLVSAAAVLVLAVLAWQGLAPPPRETDFPLGANNSANGDIELVSSDDGLEFYQDLEFYAWLEAQDPDLGS